MFNKETRKLYPDLIPEMEVINELIKEIGKGVTSSIDPINQDGTVMPKIIWKLRTYIEVSRQRVLDFTLSIGELWNSRNVGGAFVLLRCIYENVVYLYHVYKQLERYIKKNDFHSCDEMIMKSLFGAKMKEKGLPDIGNVLTMIDKLDKLITGFRDIYDNLSEFTHPNYFAMAGLYCEFVNEPYIHSHIDGALGLNKKNLSIIINSLIPSLKGFNMFLNNIEELYEPLNKLSEDDFKSNNKYTKL